MGPIAAALASSAAQAGVSLLASKLLGIGPKVPDLEAQTTAAYAARRGALSTQLRDALASVQDGAAAQGLTGTAAAAPVNALIESSAKAGAELSAAEADALASARNQGAMARFQQGQQGYQNRASGVAEILGGLGDFAGLYMAKKYGLTDTPAGAAGSPAPAAPAGMGRVGFTGLPLSNYGIVRQSLADIGTKFVPGRTVVGQGAQGGAMPTDLDMERLFRGL